MLRKSKQIIARIRITVVAITGITIDAIALIAIRVSARKIIADRKRQKQSAQQMDHKVVVAVVAVATKIALITRR
jgi:EamA domain-containing membrane protein RarD